MSYSVARAAVPPRLHLSESGASPFFWLRAVGIPALGTLLGAIAAFTTVSIADHLYVALGILGVAALFSAGALRGTLLRLVRERALRRLVARARLVDGANALGSGLEGTRVRLRGVAHAAGRTQRGWLLERRGKLFDTSFDFWLVDEHGGRTYVETADARLLGSGGLRDGDEVEVCGALARRIDRHVARLDRNVPLRPVLRADRAPLVVAPSARPLHAL